MTIGAIASSGIRFLTVFTIAEVVFKATHWFHHVDEKGNVHGNAELIAVFIGLACALVAAGLQLIGLKADHSHNRLHAFGEIVKHAALK